MEQQIQPYKIIINVAQSDDAKNIASITMQIQTENDQTYTTYNQIISALMALTEQLIKDHKKITDEKSNIQLEQSGSGTT